MLRKISLNDEGFYPNLETISAKNGKTAVGVSGAKVYDLMKQSDYAKAVGQYDDTKAGVENFKSRKVLTGGVELSPGQVDAGTNGKSLDGGIYFLEHALKETVKGSTTPYDPAVVTYGDVAYVKVYGKIDIKKGKKVDAKVQATKPDMSKASELYVGGLKPTDIKEATEEDFAERWYFIVINKNSDWYKTHKDSRKDFLAERDAETVYYLVHDLPGEFYATGDGEESVVYNTLAAALADGKKEIRKYWGVDREFNVVYLSPVNAQGEVNKVYNCDTRRNNIYDLKLRTISGLGFNYDPNDPDTPNDPNDPDGGKTPGDPNIPTPVRTTPSSRIPRILLSITPRLACR